MMETHEKQLREAALEKYLEQLAAQYPEGPKDVALVRNSLTAGFNAGWSIGQKLLGNRNETCWLIELVHDPKLPGPHYATVKRCKWTWTDDALEAVRFSRKEDAELAARFVRLRIGECKAIEHGFADLHWPNCMCDACELKRGIV